MLKNQKGVQLLGTVVHYQFGIGTDMLLSALNIACNTDKYVSEWDYAISKELSEKEYLHGLAKLYSFISLKSGISNSSLAKRLRENIKMYIGGSGFLNCDVSKIESNIISSVFDKKREIM